MKSKQKKNTDDFSQFKAKIFFRTMIMVVSTTLIVLWMRNFVLHNHFGNWMVSTFQTLLHMENAAAENLYQRIIRNNMNLIITISVLTTFFIVFRVYLNWFAKYFREINKGIDTLIDESAEEVSLSPELSATEKKINTIKHKLEKRKLDAQLAEQRKNDLIVYLAHDLKTPLASVIGYLHLLRDENQISDEVRKKYLSITLDKAGRLEDLINEFFEIAKYNLSNITLQYSRISLTRLLEMLLYEFEPVLKEKNTCCRLEIVEDVMLECDADKIQRVFDNILRNATMYSYSGTEIVISTTQLDNNVIIQFSNHGDTIPTDQLNRIFEQFYRLDAARRTSDGGAGLGLAIARQIVELHHGMITAKSENQVTTFEIVLPLS